MTDVLPAPNLREQIHEAETCLRELRERLAVEAANQRPPPFRLPPDPDSDWKLYRWPASRLTHADMDKLCQLRGRLKRPLTKLLHEAVSAYYQVLSGQKLCCTSPVLTWRGEIENAVIACLSCGFSLSDDGQLVDWHDPEEIAWEQELKESEASEVEIDGTCPTTSSPAIHGQGTPP